MKIISSPLSVLEETFQLPDISCMHQGCHLLVRFVLESDFTVALTNVSTDPDEHPVHLKSQKYIEINTKPLHT